MLYVKHLWCVEIILKGRYNSWYDMIWFKRYERRILHFVNNKEIILNKITQLVFYTKTKYCIKSHQSFYMKTGMISSHIVLMWNPYRRLLLDVLLNTLLPFTQWEQLSGMFVKHDINGTRLSINQTYCQQIFIRTN